MQGWAIPPIDWNEENLLWQQGRKFESTEGGGLTSTNKSDPYSLDTCDRSGCYMLEDFKNKGREHALTYPLKLTGMLIPFQSFKNFLKKESLNSFQKFIRDLLPWKTLNEFYHEAGMNPYPTTNEVGANMKYFSGKENGDLSMGATVISRDIEGSKVDGLTFSCAACHSANLFGKRVMGLTNKFPRAYQLFTVAKKLAPYVGETTYQTVLGASPEEAKMYTETVRHMGYVGNMKPQTLGLDSSTAQVALSLTIRNQDSVASFPAKITKEIEKRVKSHPLSHAPSDSKPPVFWNVKYKTRYFSDGALESGNPIVASVVWNEIGRGSDLEVLDDWLKANQRTIQEITSFVFGSTPPRYIDHFDNRIYLSLAQDGQKVFQKHCQGCHGMYEKGWNQPNATKLSFEEKIKTTRVIYHTKTPVVDVGTDPHRYQAMQWAAEPLNNLDISDAFGTTYVAHKGYVPPPLEGIWSRYPYLHNNSVPNLCELLKPSGQRVKQYWAGEAIDPKTDYDHRCVGYPVASAPEKWKEDEQFYFDTTKPGLSNQGHDVGIFLNDDGTEKMDAFQKMILIEFLKTL